MWIKFSKTKPKKAGIYLVVLRSLERRDRQDVTTIWFDGERFAGSDFAMCVSDLGNNTYVLEQVKNRYKNIRNMRKEFKLKKRRK